MTILPVSAPGGHEYLAATSNQYDEEAIVERDPMFRLESYEDTVVTRGRKKVTLSVGDMIKSIRLWRLVDGGMSPQQALAEVG